MRKSEASPLAKSNKPRASMSGKSATKTKSVTNSKSATKAATKAKPAAKLVTAKQPTAKTAAKRTSTPSDWRNATLARMRELILAADPEMSEEIKWRKPSNAMAGIPVWSHGGIVCTGETYKQVVKLTFAHGAKLPDPARLFNSSLEGNTRRAIDIHEGEEVDAAAFQTLIKAAVALNDSTNKKPKNAKASVMVERAVAKPLATKPAATKAKPATVKPIAAKPRKPKKDEPARLLTGGNPQIAKADGDAPVQAYIAAMPGWKRDFGQRLDALIARAVPKVCKAVKWNSPFYGVEGQGWFVSFHVFTRYVKVTFFFGTSLRPVPPGGTGKDARWIDIYENEELDEAQMTKWIKQAAALPGWLA